MKLQEDGIPPKRLPTGERRLRIRYKASAANTANFLSSQDFTMIRAHSEADAAKQAEGDFIDAMEPEEYIVEVEAGHSSLHR